MYFVKKKKIDTWELSKVRGDGKVEDCEMELVMITRGEEALTRTGSSSLISRWWESTLTAKVVSRPVPETLQVPEPLLGYLPILKLYLCCSAGNWC